MQVQFIQQPTQTSKRFGGLGLKHSASLLLLFFALFVTTINAFAFTGSVNFNSSKTKSFSVGHKSVSIAQDLIDETSEDDFHVELEYQIPHTYRYASTLITTTAIHTVYRVVSKRVGFQLPLFILFHSWKTFC